MKKGTEQELIRKTGVLPDEVLSTVTGGFDTFRDQDGIDRHSWFVTLMMNLLHTHPNSEDPAEKERRP